METNLNQNHFSKRKGCSIQAPIFLILIGAVFLLFNMGIIPSEYRCIIISWPMLLIALGTGSLFRRDYWAGVIMIAIGAMFIYPKLGLIFPGNFEGLNINLKTYWPVLLIGFGLLALLNKSIFKSKYNCTRPNCENSNDSDFIDKNVMFGGSEQIVFSQNFKGGDVNVMFGEIILDLRKAKLAEGVNYMEANVMFGSITVYVPSDWCVELNNTAMLGSFEDKRLLENRNNTENANKLVIKGSALLAGGELRN